METGTLILLNGGSSAGKLSLTRAFQDRDPQCWMLLGIDLFWGALPPEQLNLHHVRPEYYTWDSVIEEDGLEYFTIRPGSRWHRPVAHRRSRCFRSGTSTIER